MKVKPLAYDSMGVRSTCTYVETDQKILLDPGAALAPIRYGLPPSQIEKRMLEKSLNKIMRYSKRCRIIFISHYHYDHYIPNKNIYKNKILIIKHPANRINKSQELRAKDFLELIDNTPKLIEYGDPKNKKDYEKKFTSEKKNRGRVFKFGMTQIRCSPPVPHGFGPRLGYLVMCSITYKNETFVHASDVQGPQTDEATEWIISEDPDVLYVSGFPTLFLGWRLPKTNFEKSNANLIRILKETKVQTIILEHHILRDLYYKKKIRKVLETAGNLKKCIITAAEFNNRKPRFLEALRRELWLTEKDETKKSEKNDRCIRKKNLNKRGEANNKKKKRKKHSKRKRYEKR